MKVLILLSFVAVALATRECGENSHYESCGTACPLTCKNYQNPPKACVLMCNPGCHCDKGYVKTADGRCVAPEECPAESNPLGLKCGENSHFESCGTACPLTCKNYRNPPKVCVMMCKIGCQCDKGYVQTSDGQCVRPEECPAETEEVCGENQVFNGCGTACPLTCDNYQNPPKICTLQCVIGCECAKGFVKTRDGRCVRPEECPASIGIDDLVPKVCGENEVYKTCGTACPLTCDNYQNPPKVCTLQCVIGCACAKGFVKARDGRCVRPEQCPASTTTEVKSCLGESETGLCRGYFPSWYYDVKTEQCKQFVYGGCGGNGNRYSTEEECMEHCGDVLNESTSNICELPRDSGPCRALFKRFYFNKASGKCEKFVYGGCKGNSNNFKTSEECEQTCGQSA